jgi:nitrogen fixation protein NifU and related proteins
MEGATHCSHGKNPLCGDEYEIFVQIKGDVIDDVKFKGVGCAISKASASIMTTMVKGKTRKAALDLKDNFIKMVTKGCDGDCDNCLGKLKVFENVKKYPVRVKCATLIWRALENAINDTEEIASTE